MSLPDDFFKTVHGFISLPEAELLCHLASEVVAGGNIVNIGNYQGRSVCALAFGAKEHNSKVWAIDHHPTYDVTATHYSADDLQAYYANIAHYDLGRYVRTINLSSEKAWQVWLDDIALLFIDGDHEYDAIKKDFDHWSMFAETVALHDTAGYHPAVSQVLDEALAGGMWICDKFVDSMSILKRVNK